MELAPRQSTTHRWCNLCKQYIPRECWGDHQIEHAEDLRYIVMALDNQESRSLCEASDKVQAILRATGADGKDLPSFFNKEAAV